MKILRTTAALLASAGLLCLISCKHTDAVRKEGGALERELNYENAVQQEAALLGPAIY